MPCYQHLFSIDLILSLFTFSVLIKQIKYYEIVNSKEINPKILLFSKKKEKSEKLHLADKNITETIPFSKYYIINQKFYGKQNQPSPEFLTWFIGFSEGDGSFVKAKRGDLYFVITQGSRDIQVLEYIQKTLNMGKVIRQGKTTSRFIVQDLLGLYLISLIFYGELRTPSKLESYNEFLIALNNKINRGINSRKLKQFGFDSTAAMSIFDPILPYHTEPKPFTLGDN